MADNMITVTYKGYTMEQVCNNDDIYHYFYKNGKKLMCQATEGTIKANTDKQLYRYLCYLVDSGLICKLNISVVSNDVRLVPYELKEDTNEIIYVRDNRPTRNVDQLTLKEMIEKAFTEVGLPAQKEVKGIGETIIVTNRMK